MRLLKRYAFYLFFVVCLIYPFIKTQQSRGRALPVFGMLIPLSEKDSLAAHVWQQAASDEGVPLEPVYYEDLMNSLQSGVITSKVILIPDEASQLAPALLIPILQNYVKKGGKLVIVGDALTLGYNGRLKESFPIESDYKFPKVQERVGDTLQFQNSPIRATKNWVNALQIPPGRAFSKDTDDSLMQFCTYQSNDTPYPHWLTEPVQEFHGETLLQGKDGSLVAGIQKLGLGQVLWINLPLAYLKRRTDGLFLHAFLRWISEDWAGLPTLLGVPDGVGGLVLNIHVDSNASIPVLQTMKNMGIFKQGPYSIHITAGPDAREDGDGLGFNLVGNPTSQKWVKEWVKEGNEIGAHGGWIHDYFGKNIGETETPEMAGFLEKNRIELAKVTGKPILEYSAPIGNHPVWVSRWITEHGYSSYYFAGNSGMAPTRAFRDAEFTDAKLWSFPISAYRQFASFEEAQNQNIPAATVGEWLAELTDFVKDRQTVRLFYFHPPGVLAYEKVLMNWMKMNHVLADQRKFRWYTMNQIATFLTQRESVKWKVEPDPTFSSRLTLKVSAAPGIEKMVWRFSKSRVKTVKLISGNGFIRDFPSQIEFQPQDQAGAVLEFEETSP